MRASIPKPGSKAAAKALWRNHPKKFKDRKTTDLEPGVIDFWPAGFAQAHEACVFAVAPRFTAHMILIGQRPVDRLAVLASLKPDSMLSHSERFLQQTKETSALLAAILAVAHPELYVSGCKTFELLRADPDLTGSELELTLALEHWSSVFHGLSVMVNRETPLHRDMNTRPEWYDMLATVGTYTDAVLELPGLGIGLRYRSGTVVPISGKVLLHGVAKVDRDRVCLAYYMRDMMGNRVGSQPAGWFNYWTYYEMATGRSAEADAHLTVTNEFILTM